MTGNEDHDFSSLVFICFFFPQTRNGQDLLQVREVIFDFKEYDSEKRETEWFNQKKKKIPMILSSSYFMTWINDSLQVRPQLVQTHFSSHSYLNLQLFIPSIKKKNTEKGKKKP